MTQEMIHNLSDINEGIRIMKKSFIASLTIAFIVTIGWTNAHGNLESVITRTPATVKSTATLEASPKAVVDAWLNAMVTGDAETAKSHITGLPEVLVEQVIAGMIQYAKGQPLPTLEKEEIDGDKAIVTANGERIPLRKVDGKWKIDLSITLAEPNQTVAVEIKPGSPMEAMLAFYDAMIASDVERIKTMVTGTPESFATDKATEAAFFNNMIQSFQAVTGGLGQMPMLAGEKIDGDTATVTNDQGMEFPFPLKKVDGKWKINLAPMFQQF